MPKRPKARNAGATKSDAKIRMTMLEALGDQAAIATELDALDSSFEASAVLDKLVGLQCDRSFVLQTSYLYAFLLHAQECNRDQEKETRSYRRRLALVGLSWTVEDLRHHVERCRALATEIEKFLESARIPGGDLRDSGEVLMLHLSLPRVLRRYADFALDIGDRTQVNHELNNQKLRFLVSLVRHLKDRTGDPQYVSIVSLLEDMRRRCPFTSEISEDRLRKQYIRAESELSIQPVRPRNEEPK